MAQTINADNGVISGSTGLKFTADTTGIMDLQTNGTTRVTVDASGNVGVGITSLLAQLTVSGAGQTVSTISTTTGLGGTLYLRDSGGGGGNGGVVLFGAQQGSFAAIKGFLTDNANNSRGDLVVSFRNANTDTALTERIRVLSDGTLLLRGGSIPTISAYDAPFIFRIAGGGLGLGGSYETGGTSPIVLYTQGTSRMYIDSSGNVGIGTTPSATGGQLQVVGATNSASARFTGNANGMSVINQNGVTVYTNLSGGSTDTTFVAGNTASTYMAFGIHNGTSYSERMRISSAGDVGIGTTSPSSYGLFTVLSTTAGSAKINIMDNSAGAAAPLLQFGMNHSNGFNTSDAARIWTTATASNIASLNFAAYNTAAPSTAQMVLNAGNLGIGASPSYKLDVVAGPLGTAVNNQIIAQRLQVTSSNVDNLEISNLRGTAGADWTTAGWRLQQKIDSTWMAYIQFNGTASGTNSGGISFGTGQTTTNANSITERMRIDQSGNIKFSSLIYESFSSAVTAAGTTQGTATALTAQINQVTTVGASSGVILPTPTYAGLRIMVRNGSASTSLNVYPHSSGNIAGLGVNAAVAVDFGVTLEFIAFDTTNWYIPSAVLG